MRHSSLFKPMFLLGVFFPSLLLAVPPNYFPLAPGTRWTYGNERFPQSVRTVTVESLENGVYTVDYFGNLASLVPVTDGADILLPAEGQQIFYRFAEDTWLHRDLFDCDDNRIMNVAARDDSVNTPLQTFDQCLRIEYGFSRCADAGTEVEWWAPEVGRVRWSETTIAGPITFVLVSFERGDLAPVFRRGDVDGNGVLEIADAIVELQWLFLGAEPPACLDAADANDDGENNISDPITALSYLFLGARNIPAPGPETCGEDPTDDTITECKTAQTCNQGITK